MKKKLFTRTEVAEIFGVHPLTVRDWQKNGLLPSAFYVGRRPRYSLDDIEKVATKEPRLLKNLETEAHG